MLKMLILPDTKERPVKVVILRVTRRSCGQNPLAHNQTVLGSDLFELDLILYQHMETCQLFIFSLSPEDGQNATLFLYIFLSVC